MKFFVTTKINGFFTGRLISICRDAEHATKELARCIKVGDYCEAGEELVIFEGESLPRGTRQTRQERVSTDEQKARILGNSCVMNSDF